MAAQAMAVRSCVKVVVFQIGACSADVNKDLSDISLKLKFVVNGSTHLESKAGKASIGMDQQRRINFDKMAGRAIYEGGEMLHFELCRAGLLRSYQIVAKCTVPAVEVVQSIVNDPGQKLNLALMSLDTPGKVVANLAVQIGFIITTLGDVGGFRALKTPYLKLPSTTSIYEEQDGITKFCNRLNEVATSLEVAHAVAMKAIASCRQHALRSKRLEKDEAISMMVIVSRSAIVSRSSTLEMAESDGMSTSCGSSEVDEFSLERCSTTESVEMPCSPLPSQDCKVSFQPHFPQSNQFESLKTTYASAGIMSL